MPHPNIILRARLVHPIVSSPISDGAVMIAGNRIKAIGRWRDLATSSKAVIDLGDVILMPGLINAHCHLDYTHMAGQFSTPRLFIDWLKLITSTKADWTAAEYTASWLAGSEMLVRSGTTTVADIEAVPQLLPAVWNLTPLRVISLLEMIGITERRPPELVLREALDKLAALSHPRCSVALSPHAPYSTVAKLLRMTADVARRRHLLLCTHVAESKTEFDMFLHGRSEMFEWLLRSGRDMSDCGSGTPIQHLDRCGLMGKNLVAAHANYLGRGDAALLAKRQVSVVHCPRSHDFFHHDPLPLRRLLRSGVNVCLGTDSLATVVKPRHEVVELDMFAEMRLLAKRHSWLSPKTILRMATVNGARALGRAGLSGQLSKGTPADLISLPVSAKINRADEAILEYHGSVAASMINGSWALPPS